MKKAPLWHRLQSTHGILILLLLIGIAPAVWIETGHRQAIRHAEQLNRAKDRVVIAVVEISSALQGLLVEPKSVTERNRATTADKELENTVLFMQSTFSDHQELIDTVRKLRDLNNRVLEEVDRDPTSAMTNFGRNQIAIREQRNQLLNRLNDLVKDAAATESERARSHGVIGIGIVVLILLTGALIVWFQSAAVARPLSQLVSTMERMRQGDFTQRLALDGQEQFVELGEGLNRLADDLSTLVGQVQRSGIQVSTNATRIADTAREQQNTAHEIAATTADIGATSREIAATTGDLVKTIDEVSHVARDTAMLANSGQTAIARMESTMRQIMDSSSSISAKLAVLNEKTANINSVVTAITKVADQTNLLSLNAAIEAEKAGEYGLGFAVVAMEIRRLADQTAVATYDIEKTVKEMQSAVAAGVAGMDKFSDEVRHGVEEIRQVSTQLAQIIHQVQTLTPRFQTVNEGMHAQTAGARQISETLTQLSEAARQTAESLRQSDAVIGQLNEVARSLEASVAKFKVEA